MNLPLPAPPARTTLDAQCDRIIANLTARLARAARPESWAFAAVPHDFLVALPHPEFIRTSPEAVAAIPPRADFSA